MEVVVGVGVGSVRGVRFSGFFLILSKSESYLNFFF